MSLPEGRLPIVTPTYFPEGARGEIRATVLRRSVESWQRNLISKGGFSLNIIHDGFTSIDLEYPLIQHARRGQGASLNQGLQAAFQESEIAAHLVDDFELLSPYDVTPWIELLLETDTVGAVNISAPFPGCTGTITPIGTKTWCVVLNRHNLAAGLRPTIYHRRFFEYHGWFDEGISAWECERLFNVRFGASVGGPDSVLAVPFPWSPDDMGVTTGTEEP